MQSLKNADHQHLDEKNCFTNACRKELDQSDR